MSELRFRVVESAFHARAKEVVVPAERPSEYFGKYVFNREKMFKYLSSTVYALGYGIGGDALHPLVPTVDGRHGREA